MLTDLSVREQRQHLLNAISVATDATDSTQKEFTKSLREQIEVYFQMCGVLEMRIHLPILAAYGLAHLEEDLKKQAAVRCN